MRYLRDRAPNLFQVLFVTDSRHGDLHLLLLAARRLSTPLSLSLSRGSMKFLEVPALRHLSTRLSCDCGDLQLDGRIEAYSCMSRTHHHKQTNKRAARYHLSQTALDNPSIHSITCHALRIQLHPNPID